ncbi:DBH-like monooxygenase protein 2 [Cariama cristata]
MVYLRWDHDEHELMMFELQVHTTGWVAFGFSPHGQLPGSDIVIGGIFPNGSIYFSDFHMEGESALEEDKSQDYQLLSVTENEISTIMLFECHLRTCDPNNLDITFAVPVKETRYACTFIPLPMVKQKHLIYKFEPVITCHNITLGHHILVYACGNASVLPSGIDDCYGAKPDFALCCQVLINGMLVPDLHVFAYLLHTHLSGRGVKAAQYQKGEQLRVICQDNKCDFRLQDFQDMKETLITKPGGPSTTNEMCFTFLFYYPHNNISSCTGYPDILYVVHVLKQEASDAVEGMMVMDFVDWDNQTVKIAEKAAKEADQVVVIKTINELQRNESGLIRDISIPEQAACHYISGNFSLSSLKATANLRLTAVGTSESSTTKETASPPLLSLTQLVFAWLILALEYGK